MKNIILTAQSTGNNRLRLGIGTDDSRKIFKCRGVRVIIKIEGLNDIRCVTTCGNPCGKDGIWVSLNPNTKNPYKNKGWKGWADFLGKEN